MVVHDNTTVLPFPSQHDSTWQHNSYSPSQPSITVHDNTTAIPLHLSAWQHKLFPFPAQHVSTWQHNSYSPSPFQHDSTWQHITRNSAIWEQWADNGRTIRRYSKLDSAIYSEFRHMKQLFPFQSQHDRTWQHNSPFPFPSLQTSMEFYFLKFIYLCPSPFNSILWILLFQHGSTPWPPNFPCRRESTAWSQGKNPGSAPVSPHKVHSPGSVFVRPSMGTDVFLSFWGSILAS